jgi:hypothetical protein
MNMAVSHTVIFGETLLDVWGLIKFKERSVRRQTVAIIIKLDK